MSENITNNPSVPTQVVAEVKFPQFINNLGIIPTSYKDSMSYYETLAWLCKYLEETVIPTVNQNGQAVQELQGLYIQLQEYVVHYFDNLDVQQEINNKLDKMVQNGTLTTLIGNYINPFIEEQNQRISAIQNQVNLVASGSPAGVYATSSDLVADDPDHSRIYVVLADGYWYYYDGTNWTQGAVYQASEIQDGSVTPRKLSFSNTTHQLFDYTSPNIINGWIGNNLNGTISSSASSYIGYVECLPNTTYTVTKLANTGSRLCVVETADTPASGVAYSNKVGTTDPLANTTINNSYSITTSSTANYIAFFYYNSNADTTITLEQASKGIMVNQGGTALPWEPYATLDINNLLENNNISPNKINESYLRLYEGTIDINFDNSLVTINTENFLGENGRERITVASNVSNEVTISGTGVLCLTAILSGNTVTSYQFENYQLRNKNHPIILTLFPQRQTWYTPFDYGNRIHARNSEADNILSNKKMGGLGDSLIKGSSLGNTYTSLYLIAQNNNMTYTNYGINGNPISDPDNYSEGNNEGMCVRYSDMANDLDYIVVMGGANDKRLNVPIGNNSDNVVTTFKGALNILIKGLLTKYPGKKILFMTNYNRTQDANSLGLYDKDYVDAMIEMCSLYGIPCYDNYRNCGISWYTNIQTSWCDEGVYLGESINRHLSPAGYEFLVPVYETLLKSI